THTSPPEIYTLSLHDALPISGRTLELGLIPDVKAEQIGGAGSARDQVEQQQDALPLAGRGRDGVGAHDGPVERVAPHLERDELRSEEHTSELQSPCNLVCRLL